MCGGTYDNTIRFLKLTSNNLENQMVFNSETLELLSKYRSNDLAELMAEYTQEADLIKNEMATIDDKGSSEYEALMLELKELRDELESQQKMIEEKNTDREQDINVENASLETQNEDIHAQIESFKEGREQKIKDNFGYFQNN